MQHPARISLKTFLRQYLAEVFFLEGGLRTTLATLLGRPGKLSCEYCDGADQPHSRITPLRLYLGINLLFFFLIPLLNTEQFRMFSFNLDSLRAGNSWYQSLVEEQIEQCGLGETVYRERFDANLEYSKSAYFFLVVPLSALVLYATHSRRRRYFVEHLVFALHFFAFFLLALLLTLALFRAASALLSGLHGAQGWLGLLLPTGMMLWVCAYLAVALRRFYAGGWGGFLLTLPLVLLGLFAAFGLYAQFLFLHAYLGLM